MCSICSNYDVGLGIFPVLFMTCSCLTFLVTYMIAVSNGHVYPYLPTISDTGGRKPEANIFSLFLSISSFLAFITIVIRFIQFRFVSHTPEQSGSRLSRVNLIGLVIGIFSTIGAGIVAAFQDRGISLIGHGVGALGVFGGGTIYTWIQTYMTYQMFKCSLSTRRMCRFRLLLSILCTLFILGFLIFFGLAGEEWEKRSDKKRDLTSWKPGDPGFTLHVISSVCEWLLAVSLFTYFVTFTKEFNKIKVNLHIQRHRNFVTPFQTSSLSSEGDQDSLGYA